MSSPTKNLRGSTASSVDVLIIGGGFSGCWFADKLHSDKPELSVRLVEASAKLGGRLRSDENDGGGTLVKDELGGMRMFPESMPQIKALVERFKLTLAQLPLGDSTNLYYADDKAGQKKDAVMPAGGEWEGKAPGAMADAALKAYKATQYWDECGHHAYACPELRNLSIQKFFKKYASASDAEIATWFAYSGYNLYHNDVQCSIWVDDGELYGSDNPYQYFVREGYFAVVKGLFDASGLDSDTTKDKSYSMETKILSLQKVGDKVVAKTDAGETITATKVILGMTGLQLSEIDGIENYISAERMASVNGSKSIPLFKCFLDFTRPWWTDYGFMHGKSTADDTCRQMHYYDEDDILVYVSDGDTTETEYATFWGAKLKACTNQEAAVEVYKEMWAQVKKIHMMSSALAGVDESDIPDPSFDQVIWAYWPSGSHKWKMGINVPHAIEKIADGACDGSNIYITGDAFSDKQGWVEGAINTCEIAFAKAFDQ